MGIDKLSQKVGPRLATVIYSICGTYLNMSRYNNRYKKILQKLTATQKWSSDEFSKYHLSHLKNVIHEAVNYVPYYKSWAKETGFTENDFTSLEDITHFPILKQKIVKDKPELFIHEKLNKFRYRWTETGGTTGRGLKLPIELQCDHVTWAAVWRSRYRLGMSSNDWIAQFFGRNFIDPRRKKGPFYSTNYPGKQHFFSSHHMSSETIYDYINSINKLKPAIITGYPSVLARLGSYMLENGNKLNYRIKAVWLSSETLFSHQLEIIKTAFNCPCYQIYGHTEQAASISSISENELAVDEEVGYVEFVENEYGHQRIIATGLHNRAFPLIRYETGDFVTRWYLKSGRRVVDRIEGRENDFLLTKSNNRVNTINQIFKYVKNIESLQFKEVQAGEYKVSIVPANSDYQDDIYTIQKEIRKLADGEISLDFECVQSLPVTKSGKLKLIMREYS
ncbi:hypothetical protein QA601_06465 [Chitinispirillales bacterium ANBcel5]|uniref:hypothetical protein n=1 Tax=Cellulosispirillum alkaliphilum TaxID=3039283 RepID=UPI002A577763|nr:hypothetical protein [Chitinispirillales bacterium ANBcel5]